MAKYRIRVEALDPAEELRAEFRMGMECEGFCIIEEHENGHHTAIHEMNMVDIARCMANNKELMESACIARGMLEGREAARKIREANIMSNLAERLAGMMGED